MLKLFRQNVIKLVIKPLVKYKWILIIFITPVFLCLLTILGFSSYYRNRIFPGIKVAGIDVSGMTQDGVEKKLAKEVIAPEKIVLLAKNQSFDLLLREIGFGYDYSKTAAFAFSFYRSDNFPENIFLGLSSVGKTQKINLDISFDDQKLTEYLQVVSAGTAVEPKYPRISYIEGNIVIDKGTRGENVDTFAFRKKLDQNLSFRDFTPIAIPFKSIDPTITEEEANNLKVRAEKILGKTLSLSYDYTTITLKEDKLLNLLSPNNSYDEKSILEFIDKEVAPKVNHEPQDAVFKFESGKAVEFLPAKDGVTVDDFLLKNQLSQKIALLETGEQKSVNLEVPVKKAPPNITTDQVNDLGIKELLGKGISKFKGSIPGRIHNIGLASSKFKGVLIAPGKTLSFNDIVGDVSTLTGYKQAYIIKDGRTVLGDGGGVCQVSTTLFRAALNSGLPIEERRAHSYRVGYYEQGSPPGIDATVFAPTTDLKIKNDTSGHILIQTIFNPTEVTLIFEIYGTSDGRVATLTKPVVTSVTAPPEDLYVDDPTLPMGQIKQIDHKAWGAKVVFNYEVVRDGTTLYQKSFVSNYRPWQSVFLRGTGSAPIN